MYPYGRFRHPYATFACVTLSAQNATTKDHSLFHNANCMPAHEWRLFRHQGGLDTLRAECFRRDYRSIFTQVSRNAERRPVTVVAIFKNAPTGSRGKERN